MQNAIDEVQVGKARVPLAKARRWIEEYTADANSTASDPYAFPAYDRYNREFNDPARLSDADLLAPGLLNVPVKIRTFYELQRVRGELEAALANPDLDLDLAMIDDDERIAAMVRPLYAVLDDPATRPQGARATTLSKVLTASDRKALCCMIRGYGRATGIQGGSSR